MVVKTLNLSGYVQSVNDYIMLVKADEASLDKVVSNCSGEIVPVDGDIIAIKIKNNLHNIDAINHISLLSDIKVRLRPYKFCKNGVNTNGTWLELVTISV